MSFVTVGAFITANAGAIAIGSAAVGMIGAYSAARSQRQAAEYNATVADQRATVALQQGAANEDAQRRKGAMIMGTQAAGAADNGGSGDEVWAPVEWQPAKPKSLTAAEQAAFRRGRTLAMRKFAAHAGFKDVALLNAG